MIQHGWVADAGERAASAKSTPSSGNSTGVGRLQRPFRAWPRYHVLSALTAIVFAGGLAAGFAGPAVATECPAGAPIPHGLIGDTWRTVDRRRAAISGIVRVALAAD